jgi:hypothetical protein
MGGFVCATLGACQGVEQVNHLGACTQQPTAAVPLGTYSYLSPSSRLILPITCTNVHLTLMGMR